MDYEIQNLKIDKKKLSIVVRDIHPENKCETDFLHRSNYFKLLLFKTGNEKQQFIDFEEYKITTNSLFVIFPGQVHLLKNNPKEKGIIIEFTREFLEISILPSQFDWFSQFYENPKIEFDHNQFNKLFLYFEELKKLYESSSIFRIQKLYKLFGLIFFEFLEFIPDKIKLNRKRDISYAFMSLTIENFRKIRLVNEYAKLLGTPINNLEKQVKKHFGKTPLNIINELLLIEIKRILLTQKLTHKEVAFMLHFKSQASYTRFIKTHTKITPTQLKNRIRKGHQIMIRD